MKKTIIILSLLLALPIITLRANGDYSEILEFELNDSYSIRLKQISESEYTDRRKESEHLRHKPYQVVTDIVKAKKMLRKKIKGVQVQETYYDLLEVSHKDRIKKLHNVIWLGWEGEYHNFIAYYPKAGVLILNHEADGDFPIDLNDSTNEYVGNPKYYAISPDKQFRINGYFPGGAADGITYWFEKWNKSKKKYEFIEYFWEASYVAGYYFCFSCTEDWFWTNNSKVLFKYGWGEYARYYEMELITK
jgi:hypothetical protein